MGAGKGVAALDKIPVRRRKRLSLRGCVEHSRREEATSLTQEVRGSTYRHVWGGLYLIIASLAVLYIVTAPVLLIDECFRDVSRS